jgi:transcriptional regulator with XRE-family HTH domain
MDTSSLYREVGTLIRRRRRVLDLTQGELADRLGISRGGLANIETGRQNVLLHQLYRFAAALDMNVHDLLPLPREMNVRDLLPAAKGKLDLSQSKELPMPKGLTPEQKVQVARIFSSAVTRRTTTAERE